MYTPVSPPTKEKRGEVIPPLYCPTKGEGEREGFRAAAGKRKRKKCTLPKKEGSKKNAFHHAHHSAEKKRRKEGIPFPLFRRLAKRKNAVSKRGEARH